MKLALTALTVSNLKTEGIYWDRKLPAFGIRIGKIRKTWIVANDQTRIRRNIGHYPNMSLKVARDTARQLLVPIVKSKEVLVSEESKWALEVANWIERELKTGSDFTRPLVQNVVLIIKALREYGNKTYLK